MWIIIYFFAFFFNLLIFFFYSRSQAEQESTLTHVKLQLIPPWHPPHRGQHRFWRGSGLVLKTQLKTLCGTPWINICFPKTVCVCDCVYLPQVRSSVWYKVHSRLRRFSGPCSEPPVLAAPWVTAAPAASSWTLTRGWPHYVGRVWPYGTSFWPCLGHRTRAFSTNTDSVVGLGYGCVLTATLWLQRDQQTQSSDYLTAPSDKNRTWLQKLGRRDIHSFSLV